MEIDRGAAPSPAHAALVRLLQRAYSGELAAFHAYVGHARSVRDPAEKAEIAEIGRQEQDHRARVGAILAALGAGPDPARARRMARVGRAIGALCHVGGWLVPMLGAGRLERGNIVEYVVAAQLALRAERPEFVADLVDMAEVEWDHERYFREKVRSHPIGRQLPLWSEPPAREAIAAHVADAPR